MLRITRYSAPLKMQWDHFVGDSKNGALLFYRDFLEYHSDRFVDHSLVAWSGSEIIGLMPANLTGSTFWSHQGLTFGGWIVGSSMRAAMMLSLMETLKHYLASETEVRRVIYKCIPRIYHKQPAEEDLYALFRIGAQLTRRDVAVALRPKDRLPVSEQRKRNIRRAVRCGVEVRASNDFVGYHEILTNALARHHVLPVHSTTELCLLQSRFPDRVKLYASFLGSQMVAGAVVFDSGHTVHTQYLATSDEGRSTGALDILLDSLASHVYSDREYLSFGISTEQGGMHLNEGLMSQKEGFGGRSFVHDFYEFPVN
jgi:hypothetical protein